MLQALPFVVRPHKGIVAPPSFEYQPTANAVLESTALTALKPDSMMAVRKSFGPTGTVYSAGVVTLTTTQLSATSANA
jgi:hypothetical protein